MQAKTKQKKVVVIGGGTGSFVVLKGLKRYPLSITAVVNMFDSGGSSGLLRDEFGILPPGDVRRCLLALSDEREEDILRKLFMYRFEKQSSLQGHSFGNLFLTALSSILKDEVSSIRTAGELLNIKGRVLPVSTDRADVHATLENGDVIKGEKNIDVPKHDGNVKIKNVFLRPKAFLHREAKSALLDADLIVIGPGDLYTSLIPNLLAVGMKKALQKSRAKKVYITNLMTKWGETNNLSASECAQEILSYSGISKFDYIICNNKKVTKKALLSYEKEKKHPILFDRGLPLLAKKIVQAPLFSGSDIVRHNSDFLAKIIVAL